MDINTTLYGKYKLKDLTITNYDLPNMPNEAELKNLIWLAKTLTKLEEDIGSFGIVSAYRSYQVQNAVLGHSPTATVNRKKSFHEAGMAVDLYPHTMSIDAFFGKILASDYWYENLGEISIKPSQNAIHLSLPTARIKSKAMILENGSYRNLSQAEIDSYKEGYETYYTPIPSEPVEKFDVAPPDESALEFDWDYIQKTDSQSYLLDNDSSEFNLDFSFMNDAVNFLDTPEKKIGAGLGLAALGLTLFLALR